MSNTKCAELEKSYRTWAEERERIIEVKNLKMHEAEKLALENGRLTDKFLKVSSQRDAIRQRNTVLEKTILAANLPLPTVAPSPASSSWKRRPMVIFVNTRTMLRQ
jgi:hypothetical protein